MTNKNTSLMDIDEKKEQAIYNIELNLFGYLILAWFFVACSSLVSDSIRLFNKGMNINEVYFNFLVLLYVGFLMWIADKELLGKVIVLKIRRK